MKSHQYPFSAIVNQEELKLGLILNVIDPSIGGLLIVGERGTGKSTAVRALANLLPEITVVKDCPFNCNPQGPLCTYCEELLKVEGTLPVTSKKMEVVELPLGVTEDRVLGTLDLEYALRYGRRKFEPGILANANQNFLYIDEVNLLEDHIVDLLLDVSAMGIHRVEREGLSFVHPSRFILVGSMNPEEGDLRPQFLDRFGLSVKIKTITSKEERKEILRRRLRFDLEREEFLREWEPEEQALREKIIRARELLPKVETTEVILDLIVELTTGVTLDGHRGDIVLLKATRALSAFEGESFTKPEHLLKVAPLALRHRLKRKPFEAPEEEERKLYDLLSLLSRKNL